MVNIPKMGATAHNDDIQVAQAEAPRFEHVEWTKEPHLRKLYLCTVVLMFGSATTGYDGYGCTANPALSAWIAVFFESSGG